MTVGQLCRHIVHLVHTPIGVYSETGERTAFYVDHGEQQDLFARDPAFLRELLEKRDPDCPILHIEGQRAVYGIAYGGNDIYLMGPCALGHDAVTTAKYLVREHRLDSKVPYRVCTTSIGYFSEMLIMLFEMLTGRTVGESDLFFHSFCDRDFRQSLDEKVHDVFYELHEAGAIHNPYSQELRERRPSAPGIWSPFRRVSGRPTWARWAPWRRTPCGMRRTWPSSWWCWAAGPPSPGACCPRWPSPCRTPPPRATSGRPSRSGWG